MKLLNHRMLSAPRVCQLTDKWLCIKPVIRLIISIFAAFAVTAAVTITTLRQASTEIDVSQAEQVWSDAPQLARLPVLSLQALHEATRGWQEAHIEQNREQLNLRAQSTWQQLAELIETISISAHSPSEYRFNWPDKPLHSAIHQPFSARIQLTPGNYHHTGSTAALTIPILDKVAPTPPVSIATPCPNGEFTGIIVQAAWPSRGFVQLQYRGRNERVALNQLFENTWQLIAIESHQLTFRRVPAEPGCEQHSLITVAI